MKSFRDLSVRWKLTIIIMAASAAPLLLCCMAFIGYEVITFRRAMVRQLSSDAEIIGTNNHGNLRFHELGIDTRDDAMQSLSTLKSNHNMECAGIYTADGELFAKYQRDFDVELPANIEGSRETFSAAHLLVFKPIVQDSDTLGTVFLKSDLGEMYARLRQYGGIVLLFMFGAFIIAFLLASVLQRIISRPILQLAETAKQVSEKEDYSIRAVKQTNDEVGILIEGFNEMLTQIQERDKELMTATERLQKSKNKLQDYSRNLEEKVGQRTQELQEKNAHLKETLDKLKDMQDQIITQQKLASLGALTAGIAHEIKNPLNFINNFAKLSQRLTVELQDELAEEIKKLEPDARENIEEILDDLQQNVERINTHGKRADSIVRNMLMHSRGKSGERQNTDINALLDEYVSLAYHGMRAKDSTFNITIEKRLDQDVGMLDVVPQDLSRVFLNILNNACYATHEKKQQSNGAYSPTLAVSTTKLEDSVEIRIRDNGNGIPKEHLDNIFHPFFTTKPTGEGTGLGLSISYEIVVREHKGELKVETEEGSHTEFIIRLPIKSSLPDVLASAPAAAHS